MRNEITFSTTWEAEKGATVTFCGLPPNRSFRLITESQFAEYQALKREADMQLPCVTTPGQ